MKKVNPVKIYWEEFPENVDQFKNVLNPSKFQEPRKIFNSTEVMVQPKPWLIAWLFGCVNKLLLFIKSYFREDSVFY